MKDFLKGVSFISVMALAFVLGAVAVIESDKLDAAKGFIYVGGKVYKTTPMFTEKQTAEPVFCCPQVKE